MLISVGWGESCYLRAVKKFGIEKNLALEKMRNFFRKKILVIQVENPWKTFRWLLVSDFSLKSLKSFFFLLLQSFVVPMRGFPSETTTLRTWRRETGSRLTLSATTASPRWLVLPLSLFSFFVFLLSSYYLSFFSLFHLFLSPYLSVSDWSLVLFSKLTVNHFFLVVNLISFLSPSRRQQRTTPNSQFLRSD